MVHFIAKHLQYYTTPRQVEIKSSILAITYLTLVVLVWTAYLYSLNLNIKNIYQKECPVDGVLSVKIKGQLTTEDIPDSEFQVEDPRKYKRVYDQSDLIFPPYDISNIFIVATNIIKTMNQTRGRCPEVRRWDTVCLKDSDCPKGKTSFHLDGVLTGKCLDETGTCEITAWCPVEKPISPLKGKPIFEQVKDFTVMIKNAVEFPECGSNLRYRNILDSFPTHYLENCIHDRDNDTSCPIFRLDDVIRWSGHCFADVALKGAMFKINVIWNCDFDKITSNFCFPKYEFDRVDGKNEKVAPGFNFRTAQYYEEDRRDLTKIIGIKFVVSVTGSGQRFNFFQLILAFGSTIALFDLAPLVCNSLFHFFCYLKRFKPFETHFGDFSSKARFQSASALKLDKTQKPQRNETCTTNL